MKSFVFNYNVILFETKRHVTYLTTKEREKNINSNIEYFILFKSIYI